VCNRSGRGDLMTIPNADDVLAVSADNVASFIREQTDAKTLSVLMRRLNEDLLTGDESASALAEQALRHLGFRADP